MNNFITKISSLNFPSRPPFSQRCSHTNPRRLIPMCRRVPPSSRRRRRRDPRRSETLSHTSDDDPRSKIIIDVGDTKARVSDAVKSFLSAGEEAFRDLRTTVSFDRDRGVLVVAYRRSSLEFLGVVLLCSLCLVAAIRALVKFVFGLRFGMSRRGLAGAVLVRRDRGLGGREVVVGRPNDDWKVGR